MADLGAAPQDEAVVCRDHHLDGEAEGEQLVLGHVTGPDIPASRGGDLLALAFQVAGAVEQRRDDAAHGLEVAQPTMEFVQVGAGHLVREHELLQLLVRGAASRARRSAATSLLIWSSGSRTPPKGSGSGPVTSTGASSRRASRLASTAAWRVR